MSPGGTASRWTRQAGITYLGLLFAVALAGIGLAGTGALWSLESRREKEKELLFIGEEYRRAIGSYYDKGPEAAKVYPQSLEDLLQDKRFPQPVHHLRRLYRDPMSNAPDWQLIREQGRIIGIASRSTDKPIKIAGFSADQAGFEEAATLADWRFVHSAGGQQQRSAGGATPTPAAQARSSPFAGEVTAPLLKPLGNEGAPPLLKPLGEEP